MEHTSIWQSALTIFIRNTFSDCTCILFSIFKALLVQQQQQKSEHERALATLTADNSKQRDALDALTAEVTTAQKNKADGMLHVYLMCVLWVREER